MTNLERIIREFCEDENSREKQSVAGDIACRMLGCRKCPKAHSTDRHEACFMKLGKWALEEAK